jgi:hypothetical protein
VKRSSFMGGKRTLDWLSPNGEGGVSGGGHRPDHQAVIESRKSRKEIESCIFARGPLRVRAHQNLIGSKQQPPDIRAPRPTIVGFENDSAKISRRDGLLLTFVITDTDASVINGDDPAAFRNKGFGSRFPLRLKPSKNLSLPDLSGTVVKSRRSAKGRMRS